MGHYKRLDYHEKAPSWRDRFSSKGKYIGVELECVSNAGGYENLLELIPRFGFGRGPIVEQDASLPYHTGMELIFPPVSYKQLKSPKSAFAKTIAALDGKVEGYNPRRSVGMHLNVNTQGWSGNKKLLFIAVVHNLKKEALERIGGRALTSYCYQYDDSIQLDEYEITEHCTVAEWVHNRIELRFPGTTTDHKRIKELVAFIEVLELFAEEEAKHVEDASGYYTDKLERMFVEFCKKSKKGREVLGYLYEEKSSKNSDSSAQPAKSGGASPAVSSGIITTVSEW